MIAGVWHYADSTYTESGTTIPAVLSSPTPGTTLSGSSVTFSWAGGSGPSEYRLLVGTSGVGSDNLYYSGVTTATSETVTVPTNGTKLYVRLYQMINGVWQSSDYTYTESGTTVPAQLTSPTLGTQLSGSVTFTWSAGAGPAAYQLVVGTAGVGSGNLYQSGTTTLTSEAVTIPADGVTVFVRLYQEINGVWQSTDSTYRESGSYSAAKITSPQNGSTLTGSSVTFNWAGGVGPAEYRLLVGTSLGSDSIYYSGVTTATSETVTVPTNGAKLYVRLYQMINGVWQSTDYTYTAQ
jgi:prolyl oligopeptidase PreP (S9A serine peptidase family)